MIKLSREESMRETQWKVSQLWKYPIKSCRGTQVQEARIGVHGLEDDRRFMIVDAKTGMFAAQRSDDGLGVAIKSMCLIRPEIKGEAGNQWIDVTAPGMGKITIYPGLFIPVGARRREVQIWQTKCQAVIADPDTNGWFNDFLNKERPGEYELVKFPNGAERRAKMGFQQLRFADAYPFLVVSEQSLRDLNERIGGTPLPMNRFRPNIVISGGEPYDEDRLDRLVISGVELEGKTLCVRCVTTATNQETAERGKEPLATLAKYRRSKYVPDGG